MNELGARSIPYGVADFKTIRNEGLCYVDKTEYLSKLEDRDRFIFFVRPRRFGKSLFLDMLRLYYDRNEGPNFDALFGGLWIGAHPTPNRNRYLVLKLDFSEVGKGAEAPLDQKFDSYLSVRLDTLVELNEDLFDADFRRELRALSAGMKFDKVLQRAKAKGVPAYLMVDEYDNFTNDLIRRDEDVASTVEKGIVPRGQFPVDVQQKCVVHYPIARYAVFWFTMPHHVKKRMNHRLGESARNAWFRKRKNKDKREAQK